MTQTQQNTHGRSYQSGVNNRYEIWSLVDDAGNNIIVRNWHNYTKTEDNNQGLKPSQTHTK